MPVNHRVTPTIKFASPHLYTWVERGTVRVKCLAQERNTMSLARAWTQTAWSQDEHTIYEATTPSTQYTLPDNKGERCCVWLGIILNPNPKPSLKRAYLLQFFSSSPLEQSFSPLHTAVAGRHPSPWQLNSLERHSQSSSSDLSLHVKLPSHRRFFLTHSPFLHVNCLSLHLKSEKLMESVIFIKKQLELVFL